MFERFTDRARRVVVLAQEESRLFNHNFIGTEHILLGLLHEGEGVAARCLEQLGVSLDAARLQVAQIIGRASSSPSGHIPFNPRAKKVLELSLREAMTLDHDYIATQHLLLGILREGEGVAIQVLVNLGADLDRLRHLVLQAIPEGRGGEPPPARPAPSAFGAQARSVATAEMMGSGDLLLAMLGDDQSLAARALVNLGVTIEAVEIQLAALAAADRLPAEAGARQLQLRVEGEEVAVVLSEPGLAQALVVALDDRDRAKGDPGSPGPSGSEARVITNDDAAGAGFGELWADVRFGIDQVLARLGQRPLGPSYDPSGEMFAILRRHRSRRLVPTLLRLDTTGTGPQGTNPPPASPPTPPDEE